MYIEIEEAYDKLVKSGKTVTIAWISFYGSFMADTEVILATTLHTNSKALCITSGVINNQIKSVTKHSWAKTQKDYKTSALHKSVDTFYELTTIPEFNR